MKKNDSTQLSKKLIKYGAFSAAVLGASTANSQIMYTDITDETVSTGNVAFFDIDGDGTDDYAFYVGSSQGVANFALAIPASGVTSAGPAFNSNSIVGALNGNYAYPSNLSFGATIDSNNQAFNGQVGTLNFYGCYFSSSQFCDGQDGYVGLHIDIAGQTHYGWARIQVAQDASTITIKDFAYEATAGTAITAGDQGTASAENEIFNGFDYYINNNELHLSSATSAIETATIYDITGKQIQNLQINSNNGIVNIGNLQSGVYIAQANIEGQTKSFKFVKK
ncbi:T9SS type A sorting domain-containing protein [Mesonia sp. K7]|uniref:T9SS type A sorting domain-containing protein n=1 Tax=Mesonia sp. K7 TaxID=2218606 RepID=UPI000DA791D6|nr:T9SS type A sorting domain-containing protein [Mesonia sp. K7]PZD77701.1 hypothetical protein DNG35_07640 [Mesonia sp. K7]